VSHTVIAGYKQIELPDCCYTCTHAEFFPMNEYDPACAHPEVCDVNRTDRRITENGWCPLYLAENK
jgi:hypothetical protein